MILRGLKYLCIIVLWIFLPANGTSQRITTGGKPAILEIRTITEHSIRISLKPLDMRSALPYSPALSLNNDSSPVISITELYSPFSSALGKLQIEIIPNPLSVIAYSSDGKKIQEITFLPDGKLSFDLDSEPILGMGEGGPKPEKNSNWRSEKVEFDRTGRLHNMQPRWQADAYGSRNPVALMIGTNGWAMFIPTPWGQVDLRDQNKGLFIPRQFSKEDLRIQNQKNQQLNLGKGLPPADSSLTGVYDIFLFDSSNPELFFKELSLLTGPAVMPPKWALGYMQSHRTLEDEDQLIGIVDTFREKQIPIDAVIYLGTGFCPRGWNTQQPSFEFNPEVFKRNPSEVLSDLHKRNVKVVTHIVPWDREKLPGLHGNIPPLPEEMIDHSHIKSYWDQHLDLMNSGVDAFWPDEGDWFNLFERMKRHQMYYQGPLSTYPDIRPWSLHRNGYLGIAKWGGWVWSGDTESSWKTLEAQIAVGINYSLSISPFWGSDIGGFYPNEELTGELFARWFQFGAFCPSFRSHGRTWWTRLPWGWGLDTLGPLENSSNPLESELNNPKIEPICKKYAELRYRLLPYTYSITWQAHTSGMPLMRAMWIHYPLDKQACEIGNQYLWGKDILVAPVYEKSAEKRDVYLPEGEWFDWWTNERISGGKTIERKVDLSIMPIYVRAGSIIPLDPVKQYVSQATNEPVTILVYPGKNGQFSLYEDDGISQDYLNEIASLTHFSWDDSNNQLTISPDPLIHNYKPGSKRTFSVQLIGKDKAISIIYNGQKIVQEI